ncbi:hypothetical protein T440DRAFT_479269 [Plenodomus tracheiphilus IPT5]|uniref:Uncharacterized protein n=1 Tax=Plenodomus tracheiphilus IPT5 TaxID=1408161 RepID=A0A6A7B4Y4_9PLEO|nr:hypothetical protein T440DRAFT_479269 [Plenodomus tracheiphilus IPT5]
MVTRQQSAATAKTGTTLDYDAKTDESGTQDGKFEEEAVKFKTTTGARSKEEPAVHSKTQKGKNALQKAAATENMITTTGREEANSNDHTDEKNEYKDETPTNKEEPKNDAPNEDDNTSSTNTSRTTQEPIEIPETMAQLWVQSLEPTKGDLIDEQVIGVRHKDIKTQRFYLLADLKWYHQQRVPKERKEEWRTNTLKVATTRESVHIEAAELDQAYREWACFAIMAGHSDVDPQHDDEQAWQNSIYLNVYQKPIGEEAIRAHRSKTNDVVGASSSGRASEQDEGEREGEAHGDEAGKNADEDGEDNQEDGEEGSEVGEAEGGGTKADSAMSDAV